MSSTSDRDAAWIQARAGWETWAQREFRDHPAQAQAAAQAAMRAVYGRATTEQARAAGIAAGIAAAVGVPTANPAQHFAQPIPPGKIVGVARNVKRGYQWGTSFQILDFDLSRSGGLPPVGVQIRGLVLNGRIDEGDVIVIDSPGDGSRFIQADRVFNRTRNSYVEAPKGASSLFAHTEAAYGKGVARAHRGIFIGVTVWVAVIFLLVVGGFIFFIFALA